jgi:hypothetical protein
VLVRQRGPERDRVRRVRKVTVRGDAQRFLLYALAAALKNLWLAAVDEGGEASLEDAID